MNDQKRDRLPQMSPAASIVTRDWCTKKFVIFLELLILVTTCVLTTVYLNHPQPVEGPDSFEYLALAQRIATQGQVVDPHRLPGFPLLITLIFALTGQGNIGAVSVVNAMLFLLTTLEIYVITWLIFKKEWLAFLVGLLVGTNLVLHSFINGVAPEALAMVFLVSLALAGVLFIQTLHLRYLWLVAACTSGLFLTRAEWMFLPVPLFAYLLLITARRGNVRRYLLHALLAVVSLNTLLGAYIFINATQNHYAGVTDIQNINAVGKVMQYSMQNEAAPEYSAVARIVASFRTHGDDPYDLIAQYPSLTANHYEGIGSYSRSIFLHHPLEFLVKSIPVALYPWPYFYFQRHADPQGPFGKILLGLEAVYHMLYRLNIVFPLCAAVWIFLLCRRRTAQQPIVKATVLLVLLVLYGITLSTFGGYGSYTRLHAPFAPLLIFVVWASLLMGIWLILPERFRRLPGPTKNFASLI
jgi:hypothetical protein